ncbi:MAG TPA: carboxypeptidase-like regulatory domain-containing protein, partial [Pyrinomonadaceae bacterium]
MRKKVSSPLHAALAALALALLAPAARAQNTVTGAFDGYVRDSQTNAGVRGASVEIVNEGTRRSFPTKTDPRGHFYMALLPPGPYTIRVSHADYRGIEVRSRAISNRATPVVPRPVKLNSLSARLSPAAQPDTAVSRRTYSNPIIIFMTPVSTRTPAVPARQMPAFAAAPELSAETALFRGSLFRDDARREASFDTDAMQSLPLGGETLTRTFDELALLAPGVAPAPETIGGGSGPGVGAGVGTSGQFSANGLRSRANNFTVDGSDNNDEDIGVRRQGFLALVPQPVESVHEYQVITLLAPAQFGRNLGAQVNAVSRSGSKGFHGSLYGLFNSSRLNARNFFDTTNGNATTPLRSGSQPVIVAPNVAF